MPSQREVGGADHLDEIHVVERRIVGQLVRFVQRVGVVVRPRHLLRAQGSGDVSRDLRSESQVVDRVGEGVGLMVLGRVEVVVQVVHVHGAVAEAASGGDVEVPDHLVDPKSAFDPTALLALGVELLAVVLPFALLDVFSLAEGPADASVCFSYFLAGGTAAWLLGGGWRGSAVAISAVVGGEMGGFFVAVEVQCGHLDGETALGCRRELNFGETVFHAGLLLA